VTSRRAFTLAACLTVAAAQAPVAQAAGEGALDSSSPLADQGSSSKYRSEITAVHPHVAGLSVQVLQFADRLALVNHTGKTVTVYGYSGEPYARVLADGTAERNARSPATYLNDSFYGEVAVPPQANARAAPQWQVIDRTGQIEWHDHRIHYTSPAIPTQVKDQSKRTLIFSWQVPISVGSTPGAVEGRLFWVPESSSAPLAAIVVGAVIVLAGLALVWIVRRRRRDGEGRGAGSAPAEPEPGAAPGREAW
jgi:hypothetical protein